MIMHRKINGAEGKQYNWTPSGCPIQRTIINTNGTSFHLSDVICQLSSIVYGMANTCTLNKPAFEFWAAAVVVVSYKISLNFVLFVVWAKPYYHLLPKGAYRPCDHVMFLVEMSLVSEDQSSLGS